MTGGPIGVATGAATETLALFVEIEREARREDLPALARACREAVLGATRLAVDRVVLLPAGALPRTSSGKLRRGEALRLHLAGELPSLGPMAAATPAMDDASGEIADASLEPVAVGVGVGDAGDGGEA